jgi:predicted RNA-binding protein YlxR (DUF448 family)
MNPRTCIVSKTEHSPDEMIRFVVGRDSQVYPDLQRKLPGRGVWVLAKRALLEQAIAKSAFSRGFKSKVEADKDLPQLVETLLRKNALQALTMCKKAGLVETGQAKVEAAVRAGAASAFLQASNAGGDGVKKLTSAVKALKVYDEVEIQRIDEFSSDELDQALGGTNTVYVALLDGGASTKLVEMINRLSNYKVGETD